MESLESPPLQATDYSLLDELIHPVWVLGTDAHVEHVNQAWCEFSGREAAHDLAHGWVELVSPADRDRVFSLLQSSAEVASSSLADGYFRRRDGQYRQLRLGLRRSRDQAEFICSLIDVTDQEQTQQQLTLEVLRQSAATHFGRAALRDTPTTELIQEALRLATEVLALPAAMLTLLPPGGGSPEVVAHLGIERLPLPSPQPLKADPNNLQYPGDRDFPLPAEWMESAGFEYGFAVSLGQYAHSLGHIILLSNQREVLSHGTAQFIENLALPLWSSVTKERNKWELEETREKAEDSQKMEALGILAGSVAHDFNNLLTAIRCFAELLREDLQIESNRAKVDDILHASNKAGHLVRQLLSFSRNEVASPEHYELNQLLDELRSFVRSLLHDNITLDFALSDRPLWCHVDRYQLEQVLFNLCLNASDAMRSGGRLTLEVGSRLGSGSETSDWVEIRVRDSGTGIPPEVQARIFDPFFTTKPRGRGTGLGLSTCAKLVHGAGGTITFESAPERGTTFIVSLPENSPVDNDGFEDDEYDNYSPHYNTGAGRVMVVDDDDLVRLVAATLLETLGYEVISFESSLEALAYAQTSDATGLNILLTDIVMPELNGYELSKAIQSAHPGVRTLYMSGYFDDPEIQKAINDPSVAFLPKPFSTNDLASHVAALQN